MILTLRLEIIQTGHRSGFELAAEAMRLAAEDKSLAAEALRLATEAICNAYYALLFSAI